MSTITFGGLATGLDTDAIIEATMAVERQPVTRLENEKTYLDSELSGYVGLDVQLTALQAAAEELDSTVELTAQSSDPGLVTATADSSASPGSYKIEVVSLAEMQKDASTEGFVDADSQTLSGSLTIGGNSIDYVDVSLNELADIINESDSGINASIFNDGTEEGYRLILSGEEAGVTTEIFGSGSINIDTVSNGHTYNASQAHIIVDNIDIYSSSNTLTEAIPGVTLELFELSASGDTLNLTVDTDTAAIEGKVNSFVSAYNDVFNYIAKQSGTGWGNDSGFRSVKRQMQNLLTTQINVGGSYSSLAQLGFETDPKTGSLSVDSETLNEAIEHDLDSVSRLFSGDQETNGIASLFGDYLDMQTDEDTGLHAIRKKSYDSSVSRIEDNIAAMETRLVKREDSLRARYTSLELLMAELNAQSDYVTQAFSAMENN